MRIKAHIIGCLLLLTFLFTLNGVSQTNQLSEDSKNSFIIKEINQAEKGDWNAQLDLAQMYYYGEFGLPQSNEQAFYWFFKSENQGISAANACLRSQVCPRNFLEVKELLTKGAEKGDPVCQKYLGLMYGNGLGVPKNFIEAEKWYLKAALQDDRGAQSFLMCLYADHSEGAPTNAIESLAWEYIWGSHSKKGSIEDGAIQYAESQLNQQTILAAKRRSKELLEMIEKNKQQRQILGKTESYPANKASEPITPYSELTKQTRQSILTIFVQTFVEASNTGSSSNELDLYDDHVSYFDQGIVDKNYIAQDVATYQRKWPHRQYSLLNWRIEPEQSSENTKVILQIAFQISDDQKTCQGKVEDTLLIRFKNEKPSIMAVASHFIEKNTHQRKIVQKITSSPTTTPPKPPSTNSLEDQLNQGIGRLTYTDFVSEWGSPNSKEALDNGILVATWIWCPFDQFRIIRILTFDRNGVFIKWRQDFHM